MPDGGGGPAAPDHAAAAGTWQAPFVAAIAADLADDPRVAALLLAGSLGRGEADALSDVDLVAVVAPTHHAAFAATWRRRVEAVLPIVHWHAARTGAPVLCAIGRGWERIDLTLAGEADLDGLAKDGTRALIDRAGLRDRLPDTIVWPGPDRAKVAFLVAEFLRVLGLLPTVLGRGEHLAARAGLEMQRAALFQLLSEEVERADKGGMLAWRRRLSPERLAVLEALPAAEPTRPSLIAGYLAVAAAFLPRARALAARCDVAWPAAFEAATWAHLRRSIGVEPPAGVG